MLQPCIAPIEGTPAYKQGIRPGDVITHVEEEELRDDITTEEPMKRILVFAALYLLATAHLGAGDPRKAKEVGVQAADFNGLSPTYGFVRGKAKAMVTPTKQD